MGFVTWWSRTPRTTIKRLQGKGRKHHISLPSSLGHHEPHQATWEWVSPRCPRRLSWWDLCPSLISIVCPKLPTRPLDLWVINTHTLYKYYKYLWDLASLCWIPAPSGPWRPRFTLCCAQPNCPWATSPSLYEDTVWPPALHVGWPHHHVSSPSRVSSSLPPGQRWEALTPWGTGHLQGSPAPGGGMGHQKASWIDLTWGSAWAFCGVLKGSFVLFLGPHIFLCAVGQAAPLCYRSCDADRDEALSRGLGCVRLCTPQPVGQFAIICIMGPIVPFSGLDKVPCVCACVYTGAKDTPGGPCVPWARVPLLVALCSGQPHLAHQGHHANKGHPLSLLFQNEISEEKALIWLPPSHCWLLKSTLKLGRVSVTQSSNPAQDG